MAMSNVGKLTVDLIKFGFAVSTFAGYNYVKGVVDHGLNKIVPESWTESQTKHVISHLITGTVFIGGAYWLENRLPFCCCDKLGSSQDPGEFCSRVSMRMKSDGTVKSLVQGIIHVSNALAALVKQEDGGVEQVNGALLETGSDAVVKVTGDISSQIANIEFPIGLSAT